MWSPRQDLDEFKRELSGRRVAQCQIVYLDVAFDGEPAGRIELTLRADVCPNTCANFRALCNGSKGYGYKGTAFHRAIRAPRVLDAGRSRVACARAALVHLHPPTPRAAPSVHSGLDVRWRED